MQKSQLSANELSLWLKYIEHQIGFVLPVAQFSWVKSVIERHLDSNGVSSTELLMTIGRDEEKFHKLFDDILIPRTQFFRHLPSFRFMEYYTNAWKKRHVLKNANILQQQEMFYAWSVGCSSGQEAYSMALVIADVMKYYKYFLVYGSDFHQQALANAKKGIYDSVEWQFIPEQYHQQLTRLDNNKIFVGENLKRHLMFFSKNLVDYEQSVFVQPKQCQIIVCKNVLIYFRQFEQRDIINYLTQFLADDGILVIGAGESLPFVSSQLMKIPLPTLNVFCRKNPSAWLESVIQSFANQTTPMINQQSVKA